MSDTESFESVYERLYPQLHNPCGLWKAATIAEWLDDLERAHDREIAQARDPQRLRGTKPSTFDGAIEALREFRWQHATNDEDAIPYINAVKEMHDREIRDVSQQQYERGFRDGIQQEYHRGFEDGRHSMDAEHRAIAMRLRGLRFDGGSHENLAKIAYAIYPCATGWTCESADGLRDKLVDLMGGVSDDTCCCAGGGACADCDGGGSGEHEEVSDDCVDCDILGSDARGHAVDCDFHELGVSDGGTADDSAADFRGGAGCDVVHMDGLVAYDVLDNERRKAIAELQKVCTELDESVWTWIEDVAIAIGAQDEPNDEYESMLPKITDRLIHLLGGDQPSGIDVLRAMDAESDTDGTCPNDGTTSSITDELREWADSDVWSCKWEEFKAIADRIDAQFDRICQQHEAVLQETIDDVVKEYEHDRLPDQLRIEKLVRQRDAAYSCADELSDELLRVRRERDELRETCAELSAELSDQRRRTERACGAVYSSERERDELQAKLDSIRDTLDG